jgi:hypothetical protein
LRKKKKNNASSQGDDTSDKTKWIMSITFRLKLAKVVKTAGVIERLLRRDENETERIKKQRLSESSNYNVPFITDKSKVNENAATIYKKKKRKKRV